MKNMEIWNKVSTPPKSALKEIKGGRLGGMTDINPQWRMRALTEVFGAVGFGWTYKIVRTWTEQGSGDQVAAFAEVELMVKQGDEWSMPVPGIGGSMFVTKEKAGLHTSDECFKMAVTDAISVAAKAFGVAANIYEGLFDGTKFKQPEPTPSRIDDQLVKNLKQMVKDVNADEALFLNWLKETFNVSKIEDLDSGQFDSAVNMLNRKRSKAGKS